MNIVEFVNDYSGFLIFITLLISAVAYFILSIIKCVYKIKLISTLEHISAAMYRTKDDLCYQMNSIDLKLVTTNKLLSDTYYLLKKFRKDYNKDVHE